MCFAFTPEIISNWPTSLIQSLPKCQSDDESAKPPISYENMFQQINIVKKVDDYMILQFYYFSRNICSIDNAVVNDDVYRATVINNRMHYSCYNTSSFKEASLLVRSSLGWRLRYVVYRSSSWLPSQWSHSVTR